MTDPTPQPMTHEPTTPQEWNQAAREALGWGKCEARDCWLSPKGVHVDKDEEEFPDLTSVDACLKHIVPVMKKRGLSIVVTQWESTWTCHFASPCSAFYATGHGPDLALAIVKAFVRAMKGVKE